MLPYRLCKSTPQGRTSPQCTMATTFSSFSHDLEVPVRPGFACVHCSRAKVSELSPTAASRRRLCLAAKVLGWAPTKKHIHFDTLPLRSVNAVAQQERIRASAFVMLRGSDACRMSRVPAMNAATPSQPELGTFASKHMKYSELMSFSLAGNVCSEDCSAGQSLHVAASRVGYKSVPSTRQLTVSAVARRHSCNFSFSSFRAAPAS